MLRKGKVPKDQVGANIYISKGMKSRLKERFILNLGIILDGVWALGNENGVHFDKLDKPRFLWDY